VLWRCFRATRTAESAELLPPELIARLRLGADDIVDFGDYNSHAHAIVKAVARDVEKATGQNPQLVELYSGPRPGVIEVIVGFVVLNTASERKALSAASLAVAMTRPAVHCYSIRCLSLIE
jgi:hypothetical protein